MEVMLINSWFRTERRVFYPGEVYITGDKTKESLSRQFKELAEQNRNAQIKNSVKFIDLDNYIKKAHKDEKFKNLLIIRSGGIGDLIALTSIIDYFDSCNIHFLTQEKYFPLFKWFDRDIKLYKFSEPIFNDFFHKNIITKYSNWARFQGEGVVEQGHGENWMKLFMSFIGEDNPDIVWLRPQLKTDRISEDQSNIQAFSKGKKSILICNKASAMMRSCHATDIIDALPDHVKKYHDIFLYEDNLSKHDLKKLHYHKDQVVVIGKTNLDTFLLDIFDCDLLISVDSGALHFREGIDKTGIGLYSSFTVDSRTRFYQTVRSYDITSKCELMPCFMHEKPGKHWCVKGNKDSFAAPCFDAAINKGLHRQLKEIFSLL